MHESLQRRRRELFPRSLSSLSGLPLLLTSPLQPRGTATAPITYTIRRRTVHSARSPAALFRLPIAVPPLACKDMLTVRRRSAQARKNAMAPTAWSAPLEKIERLAETRERLIPCSVWTSAWAPKTKKMRLLEIRRAHPLSHRVSLVHTFAYQNVLFQITPDRSCCRAETPRAHPERRAHFVNVHPASRSIQLSDMTCYNHS